ncbi:zinc ABC transporter substrate-binding protein [bacterium]|nr:zinc ABC transporter substrate-binding protein [bacterium]
MIIGATTGVSAYRLKVVASYPYIASIVENIGKDRIQVSALARGDYDPHVIIPKPSYIGKVRKADLLIINGAQLEIGWLPPILNQAANPDILPGSRGFLDLSKYVSLIDVPESISRAQGDIHPEGNPHYYLDPYNIPPLSKAIAAKLNELDPGNESFYNGNLEAFLGLFNQKLEHWNDQMIPLKGAEVIEYHKNNDYFIRRFEMNLVGTVEPLPGIPPTSRHIESLEKIIQTKNIRFIFHDVYHPIEASRHLSIKFGLKLILIPHDVGAVKETDTIYSLYDTIIRRMVQ